MKLKSVIIGIIVLIILLVLYFWIFSDSEKNNLVTLKDAELKEIISAKDLANSSEFSFSLWVFIKDYNYNYGNKKIILHRGGTTTSTDYQFSVYLDQFQSDLGVQLKEKYNSGGSEAERFKTCSVENIPIQKWTHVLVSYRSRALDIYIDGKLTKTCTLNGNYVIPVEPKKLLICPSGIDVGGASGDKAGFRGFLGNLKYFTRAVQPKEAYAIYKEGYSGGNWLSDLFNKYKLKIAFMEDSKELNSILL